jgi:ribosomal protein S18 acetylase RimI-like enzyme
MVAEQNVRVLRLRPFSERDDAQLLTWFRTPTELKAFAGEDVAWPLTAEQLRRWRADPRIRAWSAWRPPDVESVLGHVQLVETGAAAARLARVAIAPSSRGEGHGRALVTAALAQARVLGIHSVLLNVYQDNEPAVRLYASLGFADLGPSTEYPGVRRMRRDLLEQRVKRRAR